MAEFVDVGEFVAHIRLPESQVSAQFNDVQAKLDEAESIVLALLNTTEVRRTQTAAWTVDTVPAVVKAMILKQGAYLWQFRGDEAKGEDDDGLAPGVRQLSWFYRDPVVA